MINPKPGDTVRVTVYEVLPGCSLDDLIVAHGRLTVIKERLDEWVRSWGNTTMNQGFYDCWKQIKNIVEESAGNVSR